MPRADEGASLAAAENSEVAEQFTARNAQGQPLVITKAPAQLREDAVGGLHWNGGSTGFALPDGSPVERLDESTFRIVRTGETVRREEKPHGGGTSAPSSDHLG